MNENEPSDSSGEGLIRGSVVDGKLPFCLKSLDFGLVVVQAVADGNDPS